MPWDSLLRSIVKTAWSYPHLWCLNLLIGSIGQHGIGCRGCYQFNHSPLQQPHAPVVRFTSERRFSLGGDP